IQCGKKKSRDDTTAHFISKSFITSLPSTCLLMLFPQMQTTEHKSPSPTHEQRIPCEVFLFLTFFPSSSDPRFLHATVWLQYRPAIRVFPCPTDGCLPFYWSTLHSFLRRQSLFGMLHS